MNFPSILIIAVVFGYAGWSLYRFIRKSKEGKCASCSINKHCDSGCTPGTVNHHTKSL